LTQKLITDCIKKLLRKLFLEKDIFHKICWVPKSIAESRDNQVIIFCFFFYEHKNCVCVFA
jgi:hypothetical protein